MAEEKITINGKVYGPISEIKTYSDLKMEIVSLKRKLALKTEEYASNKYKTKYETLYKRYRTLYMKYKHQSDRMIQNRAKYVEIIHGLQSEIINQANIENLIKEVDRMAEIEKRV